MKDCDDFLNLMPYGDPQLLERIPRRKQLMYDAEMFIYRCDCDLYKAGELPEPPTPPKPPKFTLWDWVCEEVIDPVFAEMLEQLFVGVKYYFFFVMIPEAVILSLLNHFVFKLR